MKIIFFGVSIFALVVSASSYAMEDGDENPHRLPLNSQISGCFQGSLLTEEDYIDFGTRAVFYDYTKSLPSPQNVLEYSNKALQRPNLTQDQLVHIYLNKAGAHDRLGKYNKVQEGYRKALKAKGEEGCLLEEEYQKQICPNFTRECGAIRMEKDTLPGLSSHRANLGILISKMKEKSIEIDFESSAPIDEVSEQFHIAQQADKSMRYNDALRDYIQTLRLATGRKDKMPARTASMITRKIGESFKEIGKILAKQWKPKVSILALKIAYNTRGIDGDKYALNESERKKLPLMIEKIKNTHRGQPSSQLSDPIKSFPEAPINKERVEAKMAEINNRLLAGGNSERVVSICDELLNLSSNNGPRSLSTSERAQVLFQKAEALRKLSNSSRGSALKQEKFKRALSCDEEAKSLLVEDENKEKAKEAKDEADNLSPNQGSKKRKIESDTETETEAETETEGNEEPESRKARMHKSKKSFPSENKDPNGSCQEPPLKKSWFIVKEAQGSWRFE